MKDSKFGPFSEKSGGDNATLELIDNVEGIFVSVFELNGERNDSISGSPANCINTGVFEMGFLRSPRLQERA